MKEKILLQGKILATLINFLDSKKIDLTQKGVPDGLAILDGNGKIPVSMIPSLGLATIFKPDITAMEGMSEEERKDKLILVKDASADPTVDSGAAIYFYDDTNSTYQKIAEMEGLDVEFPEITEDEVKNNLVAQLATQELKDVVAMFGNM